MIEYLKDLPAPPSELILALEEIEHLQDDSVGGMFGKPNNYRKYPVNAELADWLQSAFPDCDTFDYQIIRKGLRVHKDVARTECYNFLVDNGGPNSRTTWYQDDKETITHTEIIPSQVWHKLQVDVFHGVSDVDEVRIGITVYKVLDNPVIENHFK